MLADMISTAIDLALAEIFRDFVFTFRRRKSDQRGYSNQPTVMPNEEIELMPEFCHKLTITYLNLT